MTEGRRFYKKRINKLLGKSQFFKDDDQWTGLEKRIH